VHPGAPTAGCVEHDVNDRHAHARGTARRDRTGIPGYRPGDVELGRADWRAAALPILAGDCRHHVVVHGALDQTLQWLLARRGIVAGKIEQPALLDEVARTAGDARASSCR